METHNPAGDNSVSSKKIIKDQVDDNLEASNKIRNCEVANNDSQKNLLETVLTVQPLAEHSKTDEGLTANLSEGNANRKKRKRIKKKTEIKDEVQSMDQAVSMLDLQLEYKNLGQEIDGKLTENECTAQESEFSGRKEYKPCHSYQKMRSPSTSLSYLVHDWENFLDLRKQEETVLSDVVDVSSNRASKLVDKRSEPLVRPMELEMIVFPRESQLRPPPDQRARENAKFENKSNEVSNENIVVEGTTHLCSFDETEAKCLPKNLDQYPRRAPTTASRRKLLILDVNGLLAYIVMPAPKDRTGDAHILGRAIFKRPFCDDFLKFCFQNFDVGIWSSRAKKIIDGVVDYLLGDLKDKLLFCWDMSHSTQTGFQTLENTHKPLVCKELRKIWENDDPNFPWKKGDYNESNTLLLDDSPYKALLNPLHTAIFPPSYHYMDEKDYSIGPGGDLRVYLEGLLISENVREYVEHHPFGQSAINETNVSWEFYSRVLQTMSDKLGDKYPSPVPTLS